MQASDHWQGLFLAAFGAVTPVQVDAAALAGGWKALYASRHTVQDVVAPWVKSSPFEVEAAGEPAVPPPPPQGCQQNLKSQPESAS